MQTRNEQDTRSLIDSLPVRTLLSQLIMVDMPGPSPDSLLQEDFSRNPWGGIILFAKNIVDEHQLTELTGNLQKLSAQSLPSMPLLIGVDHEGGIVTRFNFPSMTPLCGNMALGATGSPEFAGQAARICADDLRKLGINLDFAPDVDVNNNPQNPIIGAHSFGESPDLVADLGRAYIRGLGDGGILATAKHFPGHGDTSWDTHRSLPTIPHSIERLESVELKPFRAAIEEDVDMIMTAHITFPALEPMEGLPATLSPRILTGLLRESMGYKGVIVTDSMAMKAITSVFGYEIAALMALQAGADLLLLCGSRDEQISALNYLEKSVDSGKLTRERLAASVERLFRLRQKLAGFSPAEATGSQEEHRRNMTEITKASITLVRNDDGLLPLSRDCRLTVVLPKYFPLSPLGEAIFSPTLPDHLTAYTGNVRKVEFDAKTGAIDEDELKRSIAESPLALFCTFCNGRLPEGQRQIYSTMAAADARIIVISLNSPYVIMDIPDARSCVYCYNYGDISMEALASVLFGEHRPSGKLPVSLPGLFEQGHSLTY